MLQKPLPPRIGKIRDGEITWDHHCDIDYELLGYFLSCHLIVEHYLDQTLKVMHPELNWKASQQSFAQKATLLSSLDLPKEYDALPAIKHMNSLRNKLSHRMNFKLRSEDLLPFIHFLQNSHDLNHPLPSEPRKVLERFTSRVCAFFGGVVAGSAYCKKITSEDV